jgi:hypothetical protein
MYFLNGKRISLLDFCGPFFTKFGLDVFLFETTQTS